MEGGAVAPRSGTGRDVPQPRHVAAMEGGRSSPPEWPVKRPTWATLSRRNGGGAQ